MPDHYLSEDIGAEISPSFRNRVLELAANAIRGPSDFVPTLTLCETAQ